MLVAAGLVAGVACSAGLMGILSRWGGYSVPIHGWRFLLWPGFMAGRLGLTHGWTAVLVALCLSAWVARRFCRTAVSWRLPVSISGLVLAYSACGLAYVFWLPVPKPAYPVLADWSYPQGEELSLYDGAYEEAYRWGIIDNWHNSSGAFEKEVQDGWMLGYAMGVAEWESIAPGLAEGSFRALLKQRSAGAAEPTGR